MILPGSSNPVCSAWTSRNHNASSAWVGPRSRIMTSNKPSLPTRAIRSQMVVCNQQIYLLTTQSRRLTSLQLQIFRIPQVLV